MATAEQTWNWPIGAYLPESAWEVANKRKLFITLHMVKDKALADPENADYICQMAQAYPDATLILAHAARSFASWTAVESVARFAKYDNVWFDFSGICESPAMFQILRKVGIENLMAVRQACMLAELIPREIENLFYDNAVALFDRKG